VLAVYMKMSVEALHWEQEACDLDHLRK
jgi:hypothetical protein